MCMCVWRVFVGVWKETGIRNIWKKEPKDRCLLVAQAGKARFGYSFVSKLRALMNHLYTKKRKDTCFEFRFRE